MKKFLYIPMAIALTFSLNSNTSVFANQLNELTSEASQNSQSNVNKTETETFSYNGAVYSILSDNTVALESISKDSSKNLTLENTISYNNKSYTLVEIKENAFANNQDLETISLNRDLQKINGDNFANLPNLQNITVDKNSIYFVSVNGILFSKNKETLIAYPAGKTETSYTVPFGTIKIGVSAFKNNSILNTVYLNSLVVEIEEYAFSNTSALDSIKSSINLKKINSFAFSGSNLKEISLSNYLEYLGTNVFEYSNIESFEVSSKLNYIPEYTFYNCSNLTSVNLHNNIEVIEDYAFYGTSIKSLIAPNSLKEIGNYAFANSKITYIYKLNVLETIEDYAFANSLLEEISLPSSFVNLGENAFLNTKQLSKIEVSNANPIFESFNNSLFNKGKTELLIVPANLSEKTFVIPDETSDLSLTALFANQKIESFEVSEDHPAFSTVDGILLSKDGKTLIKFPPARSVTDFYVPESVIKIDALAFENAQNIQGSFNIGNNVSEIHKSAFYNSSISSFQVSNNNAYFRSIDGVLYDKSGEVLYKFPPNYKSSSYTLPATVKTISSYAFSGASIFTININKVTKIEDFAFFNSNVSNVILEYGLKTIGTSAFENSIIKTISLPSSIETIENFAFKNCKNLKEIIFNGNSFKSIGENIFENCDLTSIKVPSNSYETYASLLTNYTEYIKE